MAFGESGVTLDRPASYDLIAIEKAKAGIVYNLPSIITLPSVVRDNHPIVQIPQHLVISPPPSGVEGFRYNPETLTLAGMGCGDEKPQVGDVVDSVTLQMERLQEQMVTTVLPIERKLIEQLLFAYMALPVQDRPEQPVYSGEKGTRRGLAHTATETKRQIIQRMIEEKKQEARLKKELAGEDEASDKESSSQQTTPLPSEEPSEQMPGIDYSYLRQTTYITETDGKRRPQGTALQLVVIDSRNVDEKGGNVEFTQEHRQVIEADVLWTERFLKQFYENVSRIVVVHGGQVSIAASLTDALNFNNNWWQSGSASRGYQQALDVLQAYSTDAETHLYTMGFSTGFFFSEDDRIKTLRTLAMLHQQSDSINVTVLRGLLSAETQLEKAMRLINKRRRKPIGIQPAYHLSDVFRLLLNQFPKLSAL